MVYAGFWRRLASSLLDMLFLLPVTAAHVYLASKTRLHYFYFFLPSLAIALWFNVYLVGRFGGTPGKLLLKVKIAMADGSPVTFRAALLRQSGLFVFVSASILGLALASLKVSDDVYLSLGGMVAREKQLKLLAPSWHVAADRLLEIWIWSEFLTMLFNEKRRAVHDFIAGTVVLRSLPAEEPAAPREAVRETVVP